jgi:glycosidase
MALNCVNKLRATLFPNISQLQPLWWEKSIFYEIYVRAYGRINDVTSKLDYLAELGINSIWLTPIHTSFSEHGYDIIDYYAIHPELGSLADFKYLLQQAHLRNLKVIIDLVINHTSDKHPWFISASTNPKSRYRNWYIFQNKLSRSKYWHQTDNQNSSYYAHFYRGMPDLNLGNPQVDKEILAIVKYWLKIGVDGFRLDAVKYYLETGHKYENTTATHQWLQKFRKNIKKINPNCLLIGEVWDSITNTIPYSRQRQMIPTSWFKRWDKISWSWWR